MAARSLPSRAVSTLSEPPAALLVAATLKSICSVSQQTCSRWRFAGVGACSASSHHAGARSQPGPAWPLPRDFTASVSATVQLASQQSLSVTSSPSSAGRKIAAALPAPLLQRSHTARTSTLLTQMLHWLRPIRTNAQPATMATSLTHTRPHNASRPARHWNIWVDLSQARDDRQPGDLSASPMRFKPHFPAESNLAIQISGYLRGLRSDSRQ